MGSCKLDAVSCADDVHVRVIRPTYANRYRPESDAEFVKSIAEKMRGGDDRNHESFKFTPQRQLGPGPAVVDSYSCRQMYLKSYTFVRKESMQEKTRRYIGKVREKTGDLPLLHKRRPSSGSLDGYGYGRNGDFNSRSHEHAKGAEKAKDKKHRAKLMWLSLRHLLSCTTRVDVADGNSSA